MDPEGRDVIMTASGKVLRRTDGKWVVPEEKPASKEEITLVFTGDIIFDRGQNPWSAIAYDQGIEACFDEAAWNTMQDADFLIVNNEFPYTERGSAIPGKKFTFRCPPWTAGWIKEMGADIAALANNHINDFGQDGMMDTFDALDEEDIPYIGAGRDLDDAEQTAYCIANGMTTAILNATEIERYENPETRGATEDTPGVFRCLYMDRLCEKQLLLRTGKKQPGHQTYTYSVNEDQLRNYFTSSCEKTSQLDVKKLHTEVGKKVTATCNLSSHNNRMDNLKDNQMFTETTTQFTNRFRHGTAINPALEVGDPEDFLES